MRLKGKTALVSGASHGIGKAIALDFAKEGADVAFTYRQREDGGKETARLIEAMGRRTLVIHADLTDPEACTRMVEETLRAFGQLDILVNNAGGSRKGALETLPLESWRYTFDLCVTAAFLAGQTAARHMIETGRGGSIINISSVHSSHVWPNAAPYGAAKAALNRLTKSMAVEWAKHRIRANCIAPGYINVSETEGEKAAYAAGDNSSAPLITAQRTASPSEISALAVFLASEEASYVTGQTIFADGGLLLPVITTADYMRGERVGQGFSG